MYTGLQWAWILSCHQTKWRKNTVFKIKVIREHLLQDM